METINKALSEAGLQISDLPKKTQIMIADYQNTLRGIKLQEKQGKKPAKALEKAEIYRDAILEEIFIVAEEKGQQQPPTPPAEQQPPVPPVEKIEDTPPPTPPVEPQPPQPKKSNSFFKFS